MIKNLLLILSLFIASSLVTNACAANDPLSKRASWQSPTSAEIIEKLRSALDRSGVSPEKANAVVDLWTKCVEVEDMDPLAAFVKAIATVLPEVQKITHAAEASLTEAVVVIEATGWLSASIESVEAKISCMACPPQSPLI